LRAVGFSRDQLVELRHAALLHDFGKVLVRDHVLVKAKKLYDPQLELVRQRFKYARTAIARDAYRQLLEQQLQRQMSVEELAARRQEIEKMLAMEGARLDKFLQVVMRVNEPNVSTQMTSAELNAVAEYTFPGEKGEDVALLQQFEFVQLTLARGNLADEERAEIESHVSHTFRFLSQIPWTKNLKQLPEIAYAHHEKLDGSGYPRGLTEPQIPVQSKIMTIADIYDALTARDRPYKPALLAERALDILQGEAEQGKVDSTLLNVFIESEVYKLRT
jgi:response regulator RpfG family c-di-GMP phosphodiesterase